ncbi:hypothetical protein [Labilibacter marinus]|uniref:hypothetical protein n=1 Tax=Labilibacter marinus TaxID=1477105 RepID=UPI00082BC68F|nr:hypothetical protein [Labilibacter marinus]
MRLALLVLLILICARSHAQDSLRTEIWVKVLVFDKTDDRIIENAQIISYETMQAFSTDTLGTFRNIFNDSDSLKIFSLGYDAVTVKVADFKNLPDGGEIGLTRRTYMIKSVDVQAKQELHLHLPDDIKLAKKSKDDKPLAVRSELFSSKPPVLAAVVNPISFVHYYTSKTERRKRNAIKELAKSAEQQKINTFFNRDIIKEVSGYSEGDSLTNFIVYCNVNLKLSSRDNPLIVKQQILELKEKFETDAK